MGWQPTPSGPDDLERLLDQLAIGMEELNGPPARDHLPRLVETPTVEPNDADDRGFVPFVYRLSIGNIKTLV